MFIKVHTIKSYDNAYEVIINVHHIRYLRQSWEGANYPKACKIFLTSVGSDSVHFACKESFEEIEKKMIKALNMISKDTDRFELMDFD